MSSHIGFYLLTSLLLAGATQLSSREHTRHSDALTENYTTLADRGRRNVDTNKDGSTIDSEGGSTVDSESARFLISSIRPFTAGEFFWGLFGSIGFSLAKVLLLSLLFYIDPSTVQQWAPSFG